MSGSRIPPIYRRCDEHGVTAYCAASDELGLSFQDRETGEVVRVSVSREAAWFYLNALAGVFGGMEQISQSEMSSGMPKSAVSPQDGVKV